MELTATLDSLPNNSAKQPGKIFLKFTKDQNKLFEQVQVLQLLSGLIRKNCLSEYNQDVPCNSFKVKGLMEFEYTDTTVAEATFKKHTHLLQKLIFIAC